MSENTPPTGKPVPIWFRWLEGIAVIVATVVAFWFGYNQMQINERMADAADVSTKLSKIDIDLTMQDNLISGLQFAAQASTLLEGDVLKGNDATKSFENWLACQPVGPSAEPNKPSDALSLLKLPNDARKNYRIRPQAVAVSMLVTVAKEQAAVLTNPNLDSGDDEAPTVNSTVKMLLPLVKSPDPSTAAGSLLAITQLLDSESQTALQEIRKANLSYVVFQDLESSQFDNLKLPSVDLSFSLFPPTTQVKNLGMESARLDMTSFQGMEFSDCRFSGAKGSGTVFANAMFNNCKIGTAEKKVELSKCSFKFAEFMGGSLVGKFAEGSNFESAKFTDVNMQESHLDKAVAYKSLAAEEKYGDRASSEDASVWFLGNTVLKGTTFREVIMPRAFFDKTVTIANADFSGAELISSTFGSVSVSKETQRSKASVIFSSANLKNSSFGGASLHHANFLGSLLQGASFNNAKLEWSNFADAQFNEETDFRNSTVDCCIFSGSSAVANVDYKTKEVKVSPSFGQCKTTIEENESIFIVEKLAEPVEGYTHVYMGFLTDERTRDNEAVIKFQWTFGYQEGKEVIRGGEVLDKDVKSFFKRNKVLVDPQQAEKVKNPAPAAG